MQSTRFLPNAKSICAQDRCWQSVERYTFGSKLEHGPCAPANSHGTNLLEAVFLLQRLDAAFNLGESNLLGVTSKEWREKFLEL